MAKRIHHLGMTLTEVEHRRFHERPPALSPERHDALMKKLGVTKEQDEAWHRTHLTLAEQRARSEGLTAVDPLEVGAAFVAWCATQGWIVGRGKRRFATAEGVRELGARFGIGLRSPLRP